MTSVPNPSSRSVDVLSDSESRIMAYVDNSVNQLRTDINLRLDRYQTDQANASIRVEQKLDKMLDEMVGHFNGSGHPVQTKELENLSKRIDERIEKPWKLWLWVSGAIGFVVMLCNLGMGLVAFFLTVVLPHLHLK